MAPIDELRKYKVFNIAIFDVVLCIIGLILLALTGMLGATIKDNSILFGVLGVFPIGELFHLIFKVDTPITKIL